MNFHDSVTNEARVKEAFFFFGITWMNFRYFSCHHILIVSVHIYKFIFMASNNLGTKALNYIFSQNVDL